MFTFFQKFVNVHRNVDVLGGVKIGIFFQPLRCSWPFGAFLADPWTRKVGVLKLRSGTLKPENSKNSEVVTVTVSENHVFFWGGLGLICIIAPPYPTPAPFFSPPPRKKRNPDINIKGPEVVPKTSFGTFFFRFKIPWLGK